MIKVFKENHVLKKIVIYKSSQFSYTDFMINMKLVAVGTPPYIYHHLLLHHRHSMWEKNFWYHRLFTRPKFRRKQLSICHLQSRFKYHPHKAYAWSIMSHHLQCIQKQPQLYIRMWFPTTRPCTQQQGIQTLKSVFETTKTIYQLLMTNNHCRNFAKS